MSRDGPHFLPEGWKARAVMDCILPKGVENKGSIQQREYQPSGRFPVVDQGAALIAGYTDEQTVVYQQDLPLILFGDHTRVFKFLDFPFAAGADGTKLLKPNREFVDAKFLYYALLKLEIPSRGYNRHFKYLKEREVPCPSDKAEQLAIAAVLAKIQAALEVQQKIVATLKELKAATMAKLFREGRRGERLKQTEIGEMPESWEVVDLGNVVSLFGGYAFKSQESVPQSNTQLVRMGNLYQNKLDLCRSPIFYPDDFAQKHSRFVLKPGDLIMSLTGTSGKEDYGFAVELKPVHRALLLNQRIVRIDIATEKLTKDFLLYFLLSRKFLDHLYPTAKGMKQANLSTHIMKRLKIVIPGQDEQRKVTNCLRAIDRKIDVHEKSAESLRDLFQSMLHLLMTGEVRVNSLNLEDVSQ